MAANKNAARITRVTFVPRKAATFPDLRPVERTFTYLRVKSKVNTSRGDTQYMKTFHRARLGSLLAAGGAVVLLAVPDYAASGLNTATGSASPSGGNAGQQESGL